MARPPKSGIDYFPLDTQMDESVEFIEAKYGITGFGVVIKLYQKIYGDKGYYCTWNERTAHLFAKKVGIEYDLLTAIVDDCLAEGIFNKEVFEKAGVLTSSGIQKRYVHAAERRSRVEIEFMYAVNGVSAYKNVVMVNAASTETPQRKGKETKGKEKSVPPPEALRLAGVLAEQILRSNKDYRELKDGKREATLERWAKDIDLMIRKDGRTPGDIQRVILWAHQDGFWYKNILSGRKLKEKYDRLVMDMTPKSPRRVDESGINYEAVAIAEARGGQR